MRPLTLLVLLALAGCGEPDGPLSATCSASSKVSDRDGRIGYTGICYNKWPLGGYDCVWVPTFPFSEEVRP